MEEYLHLLLPSLVRLISPAVSSTPLDMRRAVLRSLKRLLPRLQLAGHASAILHPLIKVCLRAEPPLQRWCAGCIFQIMAYTARVRSNKVHKGRNRLIACACFHLVAGGGGGCPRRAAQGCTGHHLCMRSHAGQRLHHIRAVHSYRNRQVCNSGTMERIRSNFRLATCDFLLIHCPSMPS